MYLLKWSSFETVKLWQHGDESSPEEEKEEEERKKNDNDTAEFAVVFSWILLLLLAYIDKLQNHKAGKEANIFSERE